MHRFESILNCQLMKIPFVYLGIPMGANCKRISTWKSVLDKFSKKLVSLKRFLLSFGGWICLLKSVLSSPAVLQALSQNPNLS